ncbi:Fc.00g041330.m01.CDS01 [Cosmosporella sp. VM-42]
MASRSTKTEPRVRLEDLSMKHVHDFHKMWSSERVALYSSRLVNDNFEESRDIFQRSFIDTAAKKPWIVKKAIMVPKSGVQGGEEAAGFISTGRPSPHGLKLAYQLRDDCWGRGYASAAAKQFLHEYWSRPRVAPLNEIYGQYDENGDPVEAVETNAADGIIEIKHLIAEIDFENKGSMRVAGKCDGRIIGTIDIKVLRFDGLRPHAVWQLDKPS